MPPVTKEPLHLDGLDLGDLSLDGLEITDVGDARNLPELGASSASSSCKSCSCCGSSSCCVEVEIEQTKTASIDAPSDTTTA